MNKTQLIEYGILFGAGLLALIISTIPTLISAVSLSNASAETEVGKLNNRIGDALSEQLAGIFRQIGNLFFGVLLGLQIAQSLSLGIPIIHNFLTGKPIADLYQLLYPDGIRVGAILGGVALLVIFIRCLAPGVEGIRFRPNFGAIGLSPLNALAAIPAEIIYRLLYFSVTLYLLGLFWKSGHHTPAPGAYWTAAIVVGIIVGALTMFSIWGVLSELYEETFLYYATLFIQFLIESGVGVVCAYVFWNYGLEAAIVCHASYLFVGSLITIRPVLTKV